jgi:transcription initiation factor TFIIE subunit alpha
VVRHVPKRAVTKAKKLSAAAKSRKATATKPIKAPEQPAAPKKPPRKEKDAFEERIASKLPRIEVGPDPQDVAKITAILADSRVRQMLIELGGENALAIIRNFYGNHSDDELSKKLKLKISDVRATLNKLHNEGLVNYIREKDSETGWYSYSWSLNIPRMERWAGSQSLKIGDLVGSQYYFCPTCGESSITNFDSAAEDDFRCERCNKLLDFIDEKKLNELIAGKK